VKQVQDWTSWKKQNGDKEIEGDSLVINPGRLQSHSSPQSHCRSVFLNNEEKLR